MNRTFRILIFGASYGALLGVKCAQAGHTVELVCLPREAEIINQHGVALFMPIKNQEELLEIRSSALVGVVHASSPSDIGKLDYDLVIFAMQESQYASTGVRELVLRVAGARLPCMSIMNMLPMAYLRRIPGIEVDACRDCYTSASIWEAFSPALLTACSPDPQVFRPRDGSSNVFQVRLPTNFKAAPFEDASLTSILQRLEADIAAIRVQLSGEPTEIPVKLKVSRSIYVPFAKWPMLIAGNYRCIQQSGRPLSIRDAVHADISQSSEIYEWVMKLCRAIGSDEADLVPFKKYASAALSLNSPSSAARALAAGAVAIERVDRLVATLAAQKGLHIAAVDAIVELVDLQLNRNAARA